MIFDAVENAGPYAAISPALGAALHFLGGADLGALPEGRIEIDGDRVFATVTTYRTRPVEQCRWEAHRRYGDVQAMIVGRECMGVAPLSTMREAVPYDAKSDVAFFEGSGDLITVAPGAFAVFFPQDAHMPQICAAAPAMVRKLVIKFAV
ncbi:MAG: YhcH/YjgK/YiaL family protein [Phycisphaerales bacterium]|nr:YhcH/YjgK/YiaL family protein [Phycisphaerales bacterium]